MSLATRCTGCGTVFRVVQDQLRVSAGWVRCGRCGAVFNAIESLVDVVADASPPATATSATPEATRERVMQDLRRVAGPATTPRDPGREGGTNAPGVTGDGRLGADDGAAPADVAANLEPVDEPVDEARRPTGSLDDGGNSDDDSEDVSDIVSAKDRGSTLSETDGVDVDPHGGPGEVHLPASLEMPGENPDEVRDEGPDEKDGEGHHGKLEAAHDQGPDDRPGAYSDGVLGEPAGDLPRPDVVAPTPQPAFLRRAERPARWRRPWVRTSLALLAVAGAAGLVVQAALWQHDEVAARWPAVAPALTRLCESAGCTVGPPRRLDGLAVLSSTLVRDGAPGRYRLGVTLRNRAATVVRMPAFELTLSDARGRLIVRRVLQAGDFGFDGDRLKAGAERVLEAALLAGDEPIVGYTIEIFYP